MVGKRNQTPQVDQFRIDGVLGVDQDLKAVPINGWDFSAGVWDLAGVPISGQTALIYTQTTDSVDKDIGFTPTNPTRRRSAGKGRPWKPGTPSIAATAGNNSIGYTITPPNKTGGSPIIDYLVAAYAVAGDVKLREITTTQLTGSISGGGIANNLASYLRATARNAVQSSNPSLASNIVTPRNVTPLPTPILLEGFNDAPTGWTATNATATLDTTNKVEGIGGLKIAGAGAASGAYATKTVAGPTIPMEWDTFCIAAIRTNQDAMTSITMQCLRSGSGGQITFGDVPGQYMPGLRWLAGNVNEAAMVNLQSMGSGNIQLRPKVDSNAANNAVVTFDSFRTNSRGRFQPVLTFDDIPKTLINNVFPLMQARGLVGSIYVPIDFIGTTNRCTWADIDVLQAAGWAICVDSTRDDLQTSTDPTTALISIQANMDALTARYGAAVAKSKKHFCWTGGVWNLAVAQAFQAAGMLSGRTVIPDPLFDRYGLGDIAMTIPARGFSSTAPYTQFSSIYELAKLRGCTQFFLFHDISASPSSIGWRLDYFTQALDQIVTDRDSGVADPLLVPDWHDKAIAGQGT